MKEYKQDPLLDMFRQSPDQFLSGEEISRKLSISRTAVWKQINKLRQAGYEFEALPRMGYRITETPMPLDEHMLAERLKSQKFGRKLHILSTTESTQEDARLLAEQGASEGTVVLAEEQRSGRGRMGKTFYSPFGKGIFMSIILRPEQPVHLVQQLTLLCGVAVQKAIEKTTGLKAGIKWPNDVLIGSKKVSGILLESKAEDDAVRYCIAGLGISVNIPEEGFPDELKPIATSLKVAGGRSVDRNELIVSTLHELEYLYELYKEQGFQIIADMWEASSVTLNRRVAVHTPRGITEGTASGLHSSGALLIRRDDGEWMPVFSGEIRVVPLDKE
ncbi:biotin--[acetyl-CoA-carboxylase] ligase [Paenibacillus lemnae]|uniref:Bifunctional ligase/repressor BirA n=1 Tax=Paenibacillus lemnae TaxID=1330551 RepID=A0A848MBF6_PAELE|nr:biotin--[acetyl-CoA-carboxylase] ligase [Paenibacillus lemnae]NMO98015.1 biotin--[acetyl-CoA-carboxylase] ligase [Paenibacillus lemnae]